ncbi:hypothetical protein ACTWQL_24815 [Pseudalkalibacillus sp. R45]|uniref:hypothetical protein n=1 Tax=Pseudalkalibacillus sp. R45 TaxID=3457433 RepID=UPI003FCE5DB0
MPCEKIIQVVGTLIPLDKESFGSVPSHEENFRGVSHLALQSTCTRWFITKMTPKQQSLRKVLRQMLG